MPTEFYFKIHYR